MPKKTKNYGMRVRIPVNSALTKFLLGPLGRALIMGAAVFTILFMGAFIYFYAHYSRMIDEKLRAGPFANNAKIYAASELVGVGDPVSPDDIARQAAARELLGVAWQPGRLF